MIEYPPKDLRVDLGYDEFLWKIVDRQEKKLRNQSIPSVKVVWTKHSEREPTWEPEDVMQEQHPHLFEEWRGIQVF